MPLRINVGGGPGVGKSTFVAALFARLKTAGLRVELVQEAVKAWAWAGRVPEGADQFWLLAEQARREDELLRLGVAVVTDSPLWTNVAYAAKNDSIGLEHARSYSVDFETRWPSMNFLLRRTVAYDPAGRYQDADQAQEMDRLIVKELGYVGREYVNIDPLAPDSVERVAAVCVMKQAHEPETSRD